MLRSLNIILFSCNHIIIGLIYGLIALCGGSLGFTCSILMRFELSLPGYILVSSLQYNNLITFHGILMIFFMIMPFLIGCLGNILIPLMCNINDMIFPRLNLLSLWLLFDSFGLLLFGLLLDGGANSGWTFYTPLSILGNSSIDFMFFSLHLAGLSSILGSINFMCTILVINSRDSISVSSWNISFIDSIGYSSVYSSRYYISSSSNNSRSSRNSSFSFMNRLSVYYLFIGINSFIRLSNRLIDSSFINSSRLSNSLSRLFKLIGLWVYGC